MGQRLGLQIWTLVRCCPLALRGAGFDIAERPVRTAKISADLDRMHPTKMTPMALPLEQHTSLAHEPET